MFSNLYSKKKKNNLVLWLKINISLSKQHYRAEKSAEKFLRNSVDEIEAEEFRSDDESEDNLPLVLLSDLEVESSNNFDTEEVISAPRTEHRIAVKD